MFRRTLLASLLALLLVAAPAVALPSGLPLHSAAWLTTALDGLLDLFVVEKARGTVDPNGESDTEEIRGTVDPNGMPGPRASIGSGVA